MLTPRTASMIFLANFAGIGAWPGPTMKSLLRLEHINVEL